MKKKKIISLAIIITLLVSLFNPFTVRSNATEESNEVFTVSSVDTYVGDTITVSVDMTKEFSFVAANFRLKYDATKLKYVTAESKDVLTKEGTARINADEEGVIGLGYMSMVFEGDHQLPAGNILTATFEVISGERKQSRFGIGMLANFKKHNK